jgi:hypothetical protein
MVGTIASRLASVRLNRPTTRRVACIDAANDACFIVRDSGGGSNFLLDSRFHLAAQPDS